MKFWMYRIPSKTVGKCHFAGRNDGSFGDQVRTGWGQLQLCFFFNTSSTSKTRHRINTIRDRRSWGTSRHEQLRQVKLVYEYRDFILLELWQVFHPDTKYVLTTRKLSFSVSFWQEWEVRTLWRCSSRFRKVSGTTPTWWDRWWTLHSHSHSCQTQKYSGASFRQTHKWDR